MSTPTKNVISVEVDFNEQIGLSPFTPDNKSDAPMEGGPGMEGLNHGKKCNAKEVSREIISFPTLKDQRKSIGSITNINDILDDSSLYLDNGEFFTLIQDNGRYEVKIEDGSKQSYTTKVYQDNLNNIVYRDIYSVSNKLLKLFLNKNTAYFGKLQSPVNKTMKKKNICRWILNNCKKVSISDFMAAS